MPTQLRWTGVLLQVPSGTPKTKAQQIRHNNFDKCINLQENKCAQSTNLNHVRSTEYNSATEMFQNFKLVSTQTNVHINCSKTRSLTESSHAGLTNVIPRSAEFWVCLGALLFLFVACFRFVCFVVCTMLGEIAYRLD